MPTCSFLSKEPYFLCKCDDETERLKWKFFYIKRKLFNVLLYIIILLFIIHWVILLFSYSDDRLLKKVVLSPCRDAKLEIYDQDLYDLYDKCTLELSKLISDSQEKYENNTTSSNTPSRLQQKFYNELQKLERMKCSYRESYKQKRMFNHFFYIVWMTIPFYGFFIAITTLFILSIMSKRSTQNNRRPVRHQRYWVLFVILNVITIIIVKKNVINVTDRLEMFDKFDTRYVVINC